MITLAEWKALRAPRALLPGAGYGTVRDTTLAPYTDAEARGWRIEKALVRCIGRTFTYSRAVRLDPTGQTITVQGPSRTSYRRAESDARSAIAQEGPA